MHVMSSVKPLAEIATNALKVVPSTPKYPITANVCVIAKKEKLWIHATDYERHFLQQVPDASIEEEGIACVNAKRLSEALKLLPTDQSLQITLDKKHLIIECGRTKYEVRLHAIEEFPSWPKLENYTEVVVPCPVLSSAIDLTRFAISNIETKWTLDGVLFEIEKDRFTATGSDGQRLGTASFTIDEDEDRENCQVILPKKAVDFLAWLSPSLPMVTTRISDNRVEFIGTEFRFVTAIRAGNYPPYRKILPDENELTTTITVSKVDLAIALQQAASFTDQENLVIEFEVGEDELRLVGSSILEGKATTSLPADVEGNVFKTGFIVQHWKDLLKALPPTEDGRLKIHARGTSIYLNIVTDFGVIYQHIINDYNL